ncbi:hypothetical protein D3C81_2053320 [compost metagenome]
MPFSSWTILLKLAAISPSARTRWVSCFSRTWKLPLATSLAASLKAVIGARILRPTTAVMPVPIRTLVTMANIIGHKA